LKKAGALQEEDKEEMLGECAQKNGVVLQRAFLGR
jgi:hypothetical protein